MRRLSPRASRNGRIRFQLESLEDRLPISDTIGIGLTLSALSGAAVAFSRASLSSAPPPVWVVPPAQGNSSGPSAASLLVAVPGTGGARTIARFASQPSHADLPELA